jgi:hypothetical protein
MSRLQKNPLVVKRFLNYLKNSPIFSLYWDLGDHFGLPGSGSNSHPDPDQKHWIRPFNICSGTIGEAGFSQEVEPHCNGVHGNIHFTLHPQVSESGIRILIPKIPLVWIRIC